MLQPELAALKIAVGSGAPHSKGAVELHLNHPGELTARLQDGRSKQGSHCLVNCAPNAARY